MYQACCRGAVCWGYIRNRCRCICSEMFRIINQIKAWNDILQVAVISFSNACDKISIKVDTINTPIWLKQLALFKMIIVGMLMSYPSLTWNVISFLRCDAVLFAILCNVLSHQSRFTGKASLTESATCWMVGNKLFNTKKRKHFDPEFHLIPRFALS